MRFSVPKLSHTFLRMVLFVVFASFLLAPTASVLAQGGGADSGQAGNPRGYGLSNYTDYWNNQYGPIDAGTFPTTPGLQFPAGTTDGRTLNSDGSVTVTNPQTGETTTIEPNPPATGQEFLQQSAYQSQVQLDDSHGLLVTVGGWIASAGGNMFELAYTNFALQMGCYFVRGGAGCGEAEGLLVDNGQVGDVVNVLWEVIRDLINIAIIFSLVYIGFMLILNGDDSGTKKALGGIIMAALLVNFSLYIAKVVVDVSNLTTTAIYSAMATAGNAEFGIEGEDTDGDIRVSSSVNGSNLASHFMTVLQITSMYNVEGTILNELAFAILSMFFLIFLGAIFAYGAIMMIARFLAIVVLLIFSPVMFLGLVLPNFKGISSNWRQKFMGYCLYAPAFTFMIYISLYTLIQMAPSTGSGYGAAFNGDGAAAVGSMPMFLFFFIGTGLLFMSTKVAGTIASGSGNFLTKTADGFAKKLTIGMAGAGGALIYRNTAGFAANQALKGMDRVDRSLAGAQSNVNKWSTWNPGKYVAKTALYAGREVAGGTATRGAVEGAVNYGAFGGRGRKQAKADMDAQNKRVASQKSAAENEAKQKAAIATLTDARKVAEHERTIANLSPSAVVAMANSDEGHAALMAGAAFLRPDQVKALEEDKELDKAVVKQIKDARGSSVTAKYTPATINKANSDDLQVFSLDKLTEPEYAIGLSEAKIDKLPSPKFTEGDKQKIKDARRKAIEELATGTASVGSWTVGSLLANYKHDEIARFSERALRSPAVAKELNKATLNYMRKENTQSDATMAWIRTQIRTSTDPRHAKMQTWLNTNPEGMEFGV